MSSTTAGNRVVAGAGGMDSKQPPEQWQRQEAKKCERLQKGKGSEGNQFLSSSETYSQSNAGKGDSEVMCAK